MFAIRWSKKAVKQLLCFPLKERVRISDAVDGLAAWPECRNVKALKDNSFMYRLRVGRYRILFDVETSIRIVSVQEVKKRDESTY
ncbi:MAG: type II toxin-antitoxin system RelE/ParE family toxin [Desulfococcaceae bacterium]